jgi:hypothetical protein
LAPINVSAAGKAHCPATPAIASVRSPIGERADCGVRLEDDPVARRGEPVLGDEGREQRIVRKAAPESGRADDLVGPVQLGRDAKPAG